MVLKNKLINTPTGISLNLTVRFSIYHLYSWPGLYSTIDNHSNNDIHTSLYMKYIMMIEIDECLQWLNCNTKVNHCEKRQYPNKYQILQTWWVIKNQYKITTFFVFPWYCIVQLKITCNHLFFHSPSIQSKHIIMTSLKV